MKKLLLLIPEGNRLNFDLLAQINLTPYNELSEHLISFVSKMAPANPDKVH